jgi:hypothetical protein
MMRKAGTSDSLISDRVYYSLIYNEYRAFQVSKEVDFKEERNKIK